MDLQDPRERELAYYKKQLNEAGGKRLRLQEELTAVRSTMRRTRTAASLIREAYTVDVDGQPIDRTASTLLRLLLEKVNADRAIFFVKDGEGRLASLYVIGMKAPGPIAVSEPLPSFLYSSRKNPVPAVHRWMADMIGDPLLLFTFKETHGCGLIVSRRDEDARVRLPFVAEDSEIIEGALGVFIDIREKKAADERRDFIRSVFGRYVTEEVVTDLLETPEGLGFGGQKRTVSILLSDLRGFTAASEGLPPEKVIAFLNIYLGAMTDVITRYKGIIVEFIGDAILAAFGATVARPDDAERAVACALSMQLAMEQVNKTLGHEGLPMLEMGIGINTGDVVVGNIGSLHRAKYGVVGSHVNLAGRVESFTTGGQILISESTARPVFDDLEVGQRFTIQAKGFREPLTLFDVTGLRGKHHLFLPNDFEEPAELTRDLVVRCTVLDDKRATAEVFPARVIRLSMNGADVVADRQLPPFANLKLQWLGAEQAGDVYGKTNGGHRGGSEPFRIRFTSVPSAAATMIAEQVVKRSRPTPLPSSDPPPRNA
jgi:class 3 adenylate cyclase